MTTDSLKNYPRRVLLILLSIFRRFFKTFMEVDVLLLATSMAFSSIFALVPVLAIFTSVSQMAGNFGEFSLNFKEEVLNFITSGAGETLVTRLSANLSQVKPMGLGLFGLVGLLFASLKVIYDLDSTIVKIWQEKRQTRWWKRGVVYVLLLLVSPMALSTAAGLLNWTLLNQFISLFVNTASILVLLCLFLCFKFAPPESVSTWSSFFGSLFSFALLIGGQKVYLWATVNIFTYDRLYGSLAFLPLFLLWMFLIWIFILGGLAMTKAIDDVRSSVP